MANSIIDCLNKKLEISKKEADSIKNMVSPETQAKLRIPRAITEKRVQDFADTYNLVLSKFGDDTANDVNVRAAAKQALDLATTALETKNRSIALSVEKSTKMLQSYVGAVRAGASPNDAVNSILWSMPNVRKIAGRDIGLSLEESVESNSRLVETRLQQAFSSLSDEHKFHIMSEDPRTTKMITDDYFDVMNGNKRESPKVIKDIVDTIYKVDDDLVDQLKAKGTMIQDKGIRGYLAGMHFEQGKLRSVSRDTFVNDMMGLESGIDWQRVQRFIPQPLDQKAKQELFGYMYDVELKGQTTEMPPLLKPVFRRIQGTREHARILQFKDSGSFAEFNKKYGHELFGDILNSYKDTTAKTLGVLDVLGPNPNESLLRVKNFLRGQMTPDAYGKADRAIDRGLKSYLGGFEDPLSPNQRSIVNGVSNVNRATMLGMHSLGALISEAPVIAPRAQVIAGLPVMNYFGQWARDLLHLPGTQMRREALNQAGYFVQDFMYDIKSAYNSGNMTRFEKASGWAAKAVEKACLSKVITLTTRRAVSHNFSNGLTALVESGGKDPQVSKLLGAMIFPDPDEKSFGRYLSSFGVDVDNLKNLKGYIKNFGTENTPLNKLDLGAMHASKNPEHIQMAVNLQAALQNLVFTASPESNKRWAAYAKSIATTNKSTAAIVAAGMQFTGFVGEFTSKQVMLTKNSRLGWQVASLGALTILGTVAGTLEEQIRNIVAGKNIQPVTPALVLKGFARSGIGGKVGDFVMSVGTNPNSGITDRFFPVLSTADKIKNLGMNTVKAYQGKKTTLARDSLDLLKSLTPGQNMWQTRLLLQREVFDQLLKAADPDAFYRRKTNHDTNNRQQGTKDWWGPGELTPK